MIIIRANKHIHCQGQSIYGFAFSTYNRYMLVKKRDIIMDAFQFSIGHESNFTHTLHRVLDALEAGDRITLFIHIPHLD